MTKKILSTIVSIALLTGACAMSVAAFSETDNEIARIMNQYSYYSEDCGSVGGACGVFLDPSSMGNSLLCDLGMKKAPHKRC